MFVDIKSRLIFVKQMNKFRHSSVASFLILGGGGGGGARPSNVPTEEKKSRTCNLYARVSEASERLRNIYIFMSINTCYICIYMYNQWSLLLLVIWRYNSISTKH